ncbi:MAG: GAF domain-containing protein [Proteobacteria bacterium]|nr:GAF domain-containing protein [Pseudomonadota bacterium]
MNESERKKEPAGPEEQLIALKFQVSELQQKLAVKEGELEVFRGIGQISRALSRSPEQRGKLSEILDGSLDLILKMVGAEAGTIFLKEKDGEHIVFKSVRGFGSEKLKGKKLRIGEGIAGWVTQNGRPYVSTQVTSDPLWQKEYAELADFETREILCVPLRIGDQVFGAVEAINKKDRQLLAQEDLENLSSLASQLAIVIQNARLFLESRQQAEQHSELIEVSALLNSSLDPLVVRKKAMEAATHLMGAEVGSLLLVDQEKKELYFDVALGDKGDAVKQIRLKIGEGIAGWVAEKDEALLIPDVSKDPRHFRKADQKSTFSTRDMICVPVKAKDKMIGVLQAINKQGGQIFSQEDLELFKSLANQVAIAIDNANLYTEIQRTFLETAEALAESIEKRDPYTGGHTRRVVFYSWAIAGELGLPKEEMERLRIAAVLHDIGKIGVEDRVLRKEGPLDQEELAQMRRHPEIGAHIVKHIDGLKDVVPGILHHQERFDGKGYPDGIKDGEIPIFARIIAAADTFDAMTSDRPYRKALPDQVALNELKKFAGIQFDQQVVEAFIRAYDKGKVRSVGKDTA